MQIERSPKHKLIEFRSDALVLDGPSIILEDPFGVLDVEAKFFTVDANTVQAYLRLAGSYNVWFSNALFGGPIAANSDTLLSGGAGTASQNATLSYGQHSSIAIPESRDEVLIVKPGGWVYVDRNAEYCEIFARMIWRSI